VDALGWLILWGGLLLGDDRFDVREEATTALVQAPALVAQVLAASSDPEIRHRADQVLRRQAWTWWLAELLPPPCEECDP
jgi:hypothetical protein